MKKKNRSKRRVGVRAGTHQKPWHQNTADDVHDSPARHDVRHQHSRRVGAGWVGRHSKQVAFLDLHGMPWHGCLHKAALWCQKFLHKLVHDRDMASLPGMCHMHACMFPALRAQHKLHCIAQTMRQRGLASMACRRQK